MGNEWPIDSKLTESYLQLAVQSRRWWSREGQFVHQFEKTFAKYLDTSFAVCCSNGSVALEISLKALEVGFGDFVVVPSLTFIGTATAVLRVGAFPIFADVDLKSGCIAIESLNKLRAEYGEKIRAVIIVHLGGQSCDIESIQHWCRTTKVPFIEDCAQAIGTFYKGKHVGSLGSIGCFSFQNSKNLTAGEGGCLVTNDTALADKIRKYIDYNFDPRNRVPTFTYLASNARLSEFQAAVLLAQFEDFALQNKLRESRYILLHQLIKSVDGILPISGGKDTTGGGCHFVMLRYLSKHFKRRPKCELIRYLRENNVPAWEGYDSLPLHRFPYFRDQSFMEIDPFWRKLNDAIDLPRPITNDCPNADQLTEELIWIPQFVLLRPEGEIHRIAGLFKSFKAGREGPKC